MDFHDEAFINFAFHQLSLGLLEQLWGQYTGEVTLKVTYKPHKQKLNPITEADIKTFERILKGKKTNGKSDIPEIS